MTNQSKRVALLYLGLVFVAGAVFGGAALRFYSTELAAPEASSRNRSADDVRQGLIQRYTESLDLTPEQVEQLDPILDDISKLFREFRREIEPGFDAIRAERARRIMAILTVEQQIEYQKIIDERRRRRATPAAGRNETQKSNKAKAPDKDKEICH